jgi:hypothetical protein
MRGMTLVAAIACLLEFFCADALAQQPLPPSVLILNQSTSLRPLPLAIIAGIQASMKDVDRSLSYDVDHLDLYQFGSPEQLSSLENHFRVKYRNKPIGVIIVIGPSALDLILKLRVSVWPETAIVFAAVDEATAAQKLPPGVTGTAIKMTLADLISTAKTLLPDFKRFAIVGDPFERQLYFRNFVDELPKYSRDFEFIDLMGLPLEKVRERVATLPEHTVIFYTGIMACTRFRRHRVRCFDGTGGGSWRDGSSHESSSLRLCA